MSNNRPHQQFRSYSIVAFVALSFTFQSLGGCTSSQIVDEIRTVKDWREEFLKAHEQAIYESREVYVLAIKRHAISELQAEFSDSAIRLHRIAVAKNEQCELNIALPSNQHKEASALKELIDITHDQRLQGRASLSDEMIYRQRYLNELGIQAMKQQEALASLRVNIRQELDSSIAHLRGARNKAVVQYGQETSNLAPKFDGLKAPSMKYFESEERFSENLDRLLDNIVRRANTYIICPRCKAMDGSLNLAIPQKSAHEGQFRNYVQEQSIDQLERAMRIIADASSQGEAKLVGFPCAKAGRVEPTDGSATNSNNANNDSGAFTKGSIASGSENVES